jgi:hypothetical protein
MVTLFHLRSRYQFHRRESLDGLNSWFSDGRSPPSGVFASVYEGFAKSVEGHSLRQIRSMAHLLRTWPAFSSALSGGMFWFSRKKLSGS